MAIPSVLSVAVNVADPFVEDCTVNPATPLVLVVADAGLIVSVVPRLDERVTVAPETELLLELRRVSVIVALVIPFAATDDALVVKVESEADVGGDEDPPDPPPTPGVDEALGLTVGEEFGLEIPEELAPCTAVVAMLIAGEQDHRFAVNAAPKSALARRQIVIRITKLFTDLPHSSCLYYNADWQRPGESGMTHLGC